MRPRTKKVENKKPKRKKGYAQKYRKTVRGIRGVSKNVIEI